MTRRGRGYPSAAMARPRISESPVSFVVGDLRPQEKETGRVSIIGGPEGLAWIAAPQAEPSPRARVSRPLFIFAVLRGSGPSSRLGSCFD